MKSCSKVDEKEFEREVKKWYSSYATKKLDRDLAYYDNIDGQLTNFCTPLNMGCQHWEMLDVRMPCDTHSNGLVMITNHLHGDDIREFKTPTRYAQMWMAKYFGTYAREKIGINPGRIYFRVR